MHNIFVAAATGRTRSLGGLGGRSRIEFIMSPLSRRRHNESHFAAQSPERAFLRRFRVSGFCLRSFARAKNGVNSGQRSDKISVSEAKCNICRHKRAGALHLIRPSGTFPSEGKADERLLPEHGNFLRCAQYLCCLALPACPFSGGSRGAEPH